MDPLKRFGHHGLHPEETRAFGRPVAGTAGAVLLAGENDEGHAGLPVFDGGVVDRNLGSLRIEEVEREATFDAGEHKIFDAHVGEGAAGHDPVVATAGAVAVEILRGHAFSHEVGAGGGSFLDVAGGRDVVGGDGIAKDPEAARVLHGGHGRGFEGEVFEEGRFLDVGALAIPDVGETGLGGDLVPSGVLFRKVAVEFAEDLGFQGGLHGAADFFPGGPEIAQVDSLPVLAKAERILGEIEIDAAGEGEGDDEGWGHEKVGLHRGVNAGLEVPVAGKDAGGNEVVLGDGFFHGGRERAGVADAGGAAVADKVEAELIEEGLEAGGGEVIGDDAGTGGEGGLDGGIDAEAAFDGLFGEETGGEHDGGVRSVGAGSDGGDDDGAVAKLGFAAGLRG